MFMRTTVNLKALSEAKQSKHCEKVELLRRFAPRNDGASEWLFIKMHNKTAHINENNQKPEGR